MLCSVTEWKNNLKIFLLPKAIYRYKKKKNPYQNVDGIFHGTRANNPKISLKSQKTPNNQSNFEKEELSWISNYTTKLQ